MKKTCIIGLMACICGVADLASANTINATLSQLTSENVGTTQHPNWVNAFEYDNAYEWGISIAKGTMITSASITLNATLYNESFGFLYVSLLGNTPNTGTGGNTFTGNTVSGYSGWSQSGPDYWAGHLTSSKYNALASLSYGSSSSYPNDPNDNGQTVTINLTSPELTALNNYIAANGEFGIGFDPHCTYAVSSLQFNYSCPDTAMTLLLLGASLLGLEMFRRKFVPAKVQA